MTPPPPGDVASPGPLPQNAQTGKFALAVSGPLLEQSSPPGSAGTITARARRSSSAAPSQLQGTALAAALSSASLGGNSTRSDPSNGTRNIDSLPSSSPTTPTSAKKNAGKGKRKSTSNKAAADGTTSPGIDKVILRVPSKISFPSSTDIDDMAVDDGPAPSSHHTLAANDNSSPARKRLPSNNSSKTAADAGRATKRSCAPTAAADNGPTELVSSKLLKDILEAYNKQTSELASLHAEIAQLRTENSAIPPRVPAQASTSQPTLPEIFRPHPSTTTSIPEFTFHEPIHSPLGTTPAQNNESESTFRGRSNTARGRDVDHQRPATQPQQQHPPPSPPCQNRLASYDEMIRTGISAVPNPDKDPVRRSLEALRPARCAASDSDDLPDATYTSEQSFGYRLLYFAVSERMNIGTLKQHLFVLNVQTSRIRNLRWLGSNTLEVTVDVSYYNRAIRDFVRVPIFRHIPDFDLLRRRDDVGPMAPAQVHANWNRTLGYLRIESDSKRKESPFFLSLISEIEASLPPLPDGLPLPTKKRRERKPKGKERKLPEDDNSEGPQDADVNILDDHADPKGKGCAYPASPTPALPPASSSSTPVGPPAPLSSTTSADPPLNDDEMEDGQV